MHFQEDMLHVMYRPSCGQSGPPVGAAKADQVYWNKGIGTTEKRKTIITTKREN